MASFRPVPITIASYSPSASISHPSGNHSGRGGVPSPASPWCNRIIERSSKERMAFTNKCTTDGGRIELYRVRTGDKRLLLYFEVLLKLFYTIRSTFCFITMRFAGAQKSTRPRNRKEYKFLPRSTLFPWRNPVWPLYIPQQKKHRALTTAAETSLMDHAFGALAEHGSREKLQCGALYASSVRV